MLLSFSWQPFVIICYFECFLPLFFFFPIHNYSAFEFLKISFICSIIFFSRNDLHSSELLFDLHSSKNGQWVQLSRQLELFVFITYSFLALTTNSSPNSSKSLDNNRVEVLCPRSMFIICNSEIPVLLTSSLLDSPSSSFRCRITSPMYSCNSIMQIYEFISSLQNI